METTLTTNRPIRREFLISFVVAFLITNFLFFIDEGYYDFRWMKEAGNWFVFLVYVLIQFAGQLGVFWLAKKTGRTNLSPWFAAVTGALLAISLLFTFYYLLSGI